jgi:hypothetical protein
MRAGSEFSTPFLHDQVRSAGEAIALMRDAYHANKPIILTPRRLGLVLDALTGIGAADGGAGERKSADVRLVGPEDGLDTVTLHRFHLPPAR